MTSPRLLSLLSAVETALVSQGCVVVTSPPQRAVSFQKGIARMIFGDQSGSITLQNFTLADGQICIRAQYNWAPTHVTASISIYPTGDDYNWSAAAGKIAEGWVSGTPIAAPQKARGSSHPYAVTGDLERLAAAS